MSYYLTKQETMMKKMLIILLLSTSGCHWFADNRIVVKPKPIDVNSPAFVRTLAIFIKYRYNTGNKSIEWIMADIELAKYKLLRKEQEK